MTGPGRVVTIIVPVYRGLDDLRRCIDSLTATVGSDQVTAELLLIDDCSPEPMVREFVAALDTETTGIPTRVLHNEVNLGFVATVNRGLDQCEGDTIILNADTVVTDGWLDRLAAAADSRQDVATVTPLTNFGSICTLPDSVIAAFDLDGEEPRIAECAEFVAANSLSLRPSMITGVGFCLYVTRQALDRAGPLDVSTFGAGYGEEVDFCLRTTRLGFVHLVEDSTFVYHKGGVSFGEEREEGMARGSAALHDRYPFFRAANKSERLANPLAVPYAALELGLDDRDDSRPHVLQLLHSQPGALGGTEKHLRSLMLALLPHTDFSTLYPVEAGYVLRTLWKVGDSDQPVEKEFLLPGAGRRARGPHDELAGAAVEMALDLYRFDAVHIQNLIGHSLAPLSSLAEFDGPVICSVRDLHLSCPHHWLLYRNETGCGIPEDLSLCARCLPETAGLTIEYLHEFRHTVSERLDTIDHWVFASQSAADYVLRTYDLDESRIALIEHGAIIPSAPAPRAIDESLILDEPLRVGFVGIGWMKKGLDIVNRLADQFASSSIEIHHLGPLKAEASPNLILHGPYDNRFLPERLDAIGIQITVLPGPYAETFGHVMTESLIASRPVIGPYYGAIGERIRRHGAGWTIDPDDRAGPRDLIDNLDRCRAEVLRASRAAAAVPISSVESTADTYLNLYRSTAEVPR